MVILLRNSESHLQNGVSYKKKKRVQGERETRLLKGGWHEKCKISLAQH